ncbi:hypothetical protein ACSVDE_19180 [Pseudalkalibacillus sp. Hm43]|uniref:hypothetical protein n=1 Tax=Pseudalkalibacillus sp. Hm43 TaxID=3450742 RepID=UPI003F43F6A9
MKKILAFILMFVFVFTMAACGSDDSTSGSDKEKEPAMDKTEVKSQLLVFQEEIVDVLKEHHKPFAEFEAMKAKKYDAETAEEDKPAQEELEAKLEEAKSAGPEAAEAIRAMEVPSELSQYEEDFQSALEDLAKSYEQRSEELTIDNNEDAENKADELFASFEETVGKVFEDADLLAPNIKKEIE